MTSEYSNPVTKINARISEVEMCTKKYSERIKEKVKKEGNVRKPIYYIE